MSRGQSKNDQFRKKIGERFIKVIENNLQLTLKDASKILGYKNPTTLSAIKGGRAIPDPGKLVIAALKFKNADGNPLNLNWIFTGRGAPFFGERSTVDYQKDDIINFLQTLSPQKKEALMTLLSKL